MSQRIDVHQPITDRIIAAIEQGAGEFKLPWHRPAGSIARPTNIESGKGYRGINVVSLWVEAQLKGYAMPVWGTYKQMAAAGYQVRKTASRVPAIAKTPMWSCRPGAARAARRPHGGRAWSSQRSGLRAESCMQIFHVVEDLQGHEVRADISSEGLSALHAACRVSGWRSTPCRLPQ